MKNNFIRNLLIYTLIIFGFILIHIIDIENLLYPDNKKEVKSKVDFVYQQF